MGIRRALPRGSYRPPFWDDFNYRVVSAEYCSDVGWLDLDVATCEQCAQQVACRAGPL